MGKLMKCDAVYKKPFWREAGLNGFGINDSGAARAVFDNSPEDGDPGVLLAFMGGDTWKKYGRLPQAKRRKAVLEGFAAMFGDEALHPIEYTEHDWTKERWTGGGPTAIHAADGAFSSSDRRSAARSAGCTGPAPRPRRTGRATWTARSAPASGPRSR